MDDVNDNVNDMYCSVDSFVDMCRGPSEQNFSILHINIRSFNRNSDELNVFIDRLGVKPDILVLTETWFSSNYTDDLCGYGAYHVYRENKRGGGVSIYVRNSIKCTLLPDHSYVGDNFEICSCAISVGERRLVVHGIYRPPDRDIRSFSDELSVLLSIAQRTDDVFLVGDLNIDLANPGDSESEFIHMCQASSFIPLISLPTHITPRRLSCLDHFWYNQLCDVKSGVLRVDITDHYPIFVIIPICTPSDRFFLKSFRDHSTASLERLRNEMYGLSSEFENMLKAENCDINALTELFCDRIYAIYDYCCPIRTKRISRNRYMKPWLSDALIGCVKRKHSLYMQYRRGIVDYNAYNTFKNHVTRILKLTKRRYFINKFSAEISNSRETWKIINSLVNKSRSNLVPSEMLSDQTVVTGSVNIANCFNRYFSGIAARLDAGIPSTNVSPIDYIGDRLPYSFFVRPVTELDALTEINALKIKPSNLLSIPNFIYKICRDIFSPLISNLFNLSISSGTFPTCLKTARVVPIFKSGDSTLPSNYRPISTLSVLSKLFEKFMSKQLISFLKLHNVFSTCQFGFMANSSTSDAILEFLNNLYESLDLKKLSMAVFLDLSKAFDTVSHDILIDKLEYLGIRGLPLEWFRSYLRDRKQYVSICGSHSTLCNVDCGVPQGSVLGPTLFLVYINDMSKCSNVLNFIHFADDTTVFCSGECIDDVTSSINTELEKIVTWLNTNRLSLNLKKTSYMLFTDRTLTHSPSVKIAGVDIDCVNQANFLGITIDNNLTFKSHVDSISKKISKSIGMINRISNIVPPIAKKKIYFSLVYSRVSYGILAWGRSSLFNTGRMERHLKRARRAVAYPYNDVNCLIHTFLNFDSIYKYFSCLKLFKVIRLNQHPYFHSILNNLDPHHNHGTRFSNCSKFNKPAYSKSKCQKNFIYQSVCTWNDLPEFVKECPTLGLFKKKLKSELYVSQGTSN